MAGPSTYSLPIDVLTNCCSYLPTGDVLRFFALSKSCYQIRHDSSMWELWIDRLHPDDAARLWSYLLRFSNCSQHPFYSQLKSIRSKLLSDLWPAKIMQQQKKNTKEEMEIRQQQMRLQGRPTHHNLNPRLNPHTPLAEAILMKAFKAFDTEVITHFSQHIPLVVTAGISDNPTLGYRPSRDSVIRRPYKGTGTQTQPRGSCLETEGTAEALDRMWTPTPLWSQARISRVKLFGSGKGVGEFWLRNTRVYPNRPTTTTTIQREFTLGKLSNSDHYSIPGFQGETSTRDKEFDGVTVWIGAPPGFIGSSKISHVTGEKSNRNSGKFNREHTFYLQRD